MEGIYNVTAIARDRRTGEDISDERTERIDIDTNELFSGCVDEDDIKFVYESFWNDMNPLSQETVHVLSVEKDV